MNRRLFVVIGCHGDANTPACPHRSNPTRTPGAGYALDYRCGASGIMIDGYIEWPSEMRKPGDFPKSCPLENAPPQRPQMRWGCPAKMVAPSKFDQGERFSFQGEYLGHALASAGQRWICTNSGCGGVFADPVNPESADEPRATTVVCAEHTDEELNGCVLT